MLQHATILLGLSIITLPMAAQDTHFERNMPAGDRLELSNINGSIRVTQGTGRRARITITKLVKSGNGDLVKAILEEGDGFVHVCTVYLNRDPNRSTCGGENSNDSRKDPRFKHFEVQLDYVVTLPAGVRLDAESVNGAITIRGVDTPATASTVNGAIRFDGVGAHRLETVNGDITGRFSSSSWEGALALETVNGSIDLSVPADFGADIRGETINGAIDLGEFPVTIRGKWGPKSFSGTIGKGGRRVTIETVNGSVRLRRR